QKFGLKAFNDLFKRFLFILKGKFFVSKKFLKFA
ncbi:hypothetical protein Mgra_00003570, partial [Meloidogyne graminicola]